MSNEVEDDKLNSSTRSFIRGENESAEEECQTLLENDTPTKFGQERKFSKLNFDPKENQEKRRREFLEAQQKRRDAVIDKIRQLEESFSDNEEEGEDFVDFATNHSKLEDKNGAKMEEEPLDPAKDKKKNIHNKGRRNRKRDKNIINIMHSEWLISKPEDFEENWIGVMCPVGKRVLIVANKGSTKIFARNGEYFGSYSSPLPGGHKFKQNDNEGRGVTLLDAFWSKLTQSFYILDIIAWNSHSCSNCDTEYRQFLLQSKLSEMDNLMKRSETNPFPFVPLPFFPTSNLNQVLLNGELAFPEEVDGILFYHKEAFYMAGVNPLCLWIHLDGVEEKLNISVAPELLQRQHKPKPKSSNASKMEL